MERWDFCASLAHDGAYQLLTPEGERVGPDDLTGQQAYCLVLALNLGEHRVATGPVESLNPVGAGNLDRAIFAASIQREATAERVSCPRCGSYELARATICANCHERFNPDLQSVLGILAAYQQTPTPGDLGAA